MMTLAEQEKVYRDWDTGSWLAVQGYQSLDELERSGVKLTPAMIVGFLRERAARSASRKEIHQCASMQELQLLMYRVIDQEGR